MITIAQFKNYIKYVLKHKYYVFVFGNKLHVSIWRTFTHDLSKFTLKEFIPYAKTFYSPTGANQYSPNLDFDLAWLHHQKANKHHHQYWVLQCDDGNVQPLPMPEEYVKEMIADWASVSLIVKGKDALVSDWFKYNKHKMKLHKETEQLINKYLQQLETI